MNFLQCNKNEFYVHIQKLNYFHLLNNHDKLNIIQDLIYNIGLFDHKSNILYNMTYLIISFL